MKLPVTQTFASRGNPGNLPAISGKGVPIQEYEMVLAQNQAAASRAKNANNRARNEKTKGEELAAGIAASHTIGGLAGLAISVPITYGLGRLVDSPKALMITEGILSAGELGISLLGHLIGMPLVGAMGTSLATGTINSVIAKTARAHNFEDVQKDPKRLEKFTARQADKKSRLAEVRGTPDFNQATGAYDDLGNMSGQALVAGSGPQAPRSDARIERLQSRRRTNLARRLYWNARQRVPHEQATGFVQRVLPHVVGRYEAEEMSAAGADVSGPMSLVLSQLFERAFAPQPKPNAAITVPQAAPVSGNCTAADLDIAEMLGAGVWHESDTGALTFVPVEGEDGNELSSDELAATIQGLVTGDAGAFERTKAWWGTRKSRKAMRKAASRKKTKAYSRKYITKARAKAKAKTRPAEAEARRARQDELAEDVQWKQTQQWENEPMAEDNWGDEGGYEGDEGGYEGDEGGYYEDDYGY